MDNHGLKYGTFAKFIEDMIALRIYKIAEEQNFGEYLSIDQIGDEFGLSRFKVNRLIKAGKLKPLKMRTGYRMTLFLRADIDHLIETGVIPRAERT